MRLILFLLTGCTIFFACGGGSTTGAVANLEGYTTESISGSNVTRAYKSDADGNLLEEGYISNGKRNGVWTTYWDGDHVGKIKTITSYSDGMLNGPYLELTNRSQIETEVYYKKNEYHGPFSKYKFGRLEKRQEYKDNMLDGLTVEYNNKGDVQREINYKEGKQHGTMKYYNDEGEVTVEYEYKNGEKVSGGMVNNK